MKLSLECLWLLAIVCAVWLNLITQAQITSEDALWKRLYEAGQSRSGEANYDEAEKQFQAALKRAQTIKARKLIAETCEALATLYDEQKKFGQAERHYHCLLEAEEKSLGGDNYLLGETLFKLIQFYIENEHYAKAIELAKRFQKITEKNFPPDHSEVAGSLEIIGFLYAMAGNQAEAEKYVKLAESRRSESKNKTPRIADGDDLLRQDENARKGMEAYAQGRIAEAGEHYQNALLAAEAAGRRDHLLVVILEAIAGNYSAQQNPSASVPFYERAVALREELLPWETPELLPRLRMLSIRISSLNSSYESADYEDPVRREKWIKGGVKEFPRIEALLKKDAALWERAVGTENMEYSVRLSSLRKYYLDRFAESYRELTERLREQWKREGRKPEASGKNPKNTFGELHEMIEKVAGGEVRRNPYFVKGMELWNRTLAIREKLFEQDHHFVRGELEEMARFFNAYGMEPERAAAEKRIAAIDAAPKKAPAGGFEGLKKNADDRRKLGREEEAAGIEARAKVLEAAAAMESRKVASKKTAAPAEENSQAGATRLCRKMNIYALLGPVFTLPLWDQPEFRASGNRLLAGIRSSWGDRPLLEGRFGEINPDTMKLEAMAVAENGKLWEEATPLIKQPHQHNRKYEFARNAKGETEMRELVADPRGIALEPDGAARAEFTIQTEFAERKGFFDDHPSRYPRLSLLKLEIFDGEKKIGEQTFKNTRGDWATAFFTPKEDVRGFRSISWLKAGNRRFLIFDDLAEHDSLYGGSYVICVLPSVNR